MREICEGVRKEEGEKERERVRDESKEISG